MATPNTFSGLDGLPFHVSVGAIVVNAEGQILTHHFLPNLLYSGSPELYLLMRETVEPNESLERALERGLAEEFGVKCDHCEYIGSLVSSFKHGRRPDLLVEKTTLYFLCQNPTDLPGARLLDSVEGKSQLEWLDSPELIRLSQAQVAKRQKSDLDETTIVKRAEKILEQRLNFPR